MQDLDEKIEPEETKTEQYRQNENGNKKNNSKDVVAACCCTKCCCKFANHDKAHGMQQQQQNNGDKQHEKSHAENENRNLNPKKFTKQQMQQLREKNAKTRMCLITGGVELVPLLARRRAMQRPISLSTTDVTKCPNANK